MPFDMTPETTITPTERARHLRHQGKPWSVVSAALRHRCTPQERVSILKRVQGEEAVI